MARKASPAAARKAQAVEAYQEQFGRAPAKRMTAADIERSMPRVAAPARPVGAVPQRPAVSVRPNDVGRFDAKTASPRVLRGYNSSAVRSAASKLPMQQFDQYISNRFKDRATAAKGLRDYRSTLGRNVPSSLGSAVAKGRGAEFAVSKVGKAVQTLNPYRVGIAPTAAGILALGMGVRAAKGAFEGYLTDGTRGAVRATADAITLGMGGGKVVDKVLGTPNFGKEAEGVFGLETPGQTGARRRAEMINSRPTMPGMKAIAKAKGEAKPKKVEVPGETRDLAKGLNAIAAGGVAGSAGVVAYDLASRGVSAIGRGLVKTAPLASRHPVGLALAVGAIAAAGIASAVGSRSKPAAAAPPSGKDRTDPYTDKLGRNFANGRKIVRKS